MKPSVAAIAVLLIPAGYGPVLSEQAPVEQSIHSLGLGSGTVVIPTAANTAGRGGRFYKTRVVIHNLTDRSYGIAVLLYGREGFIRQKTLRLIPRGYYVWDNFLENLFSYRGNCAIVVDAFVSLDSEKGDFLGFPDYSPNQFSVSAEVYTDSPNGRISTQVTNGIVPPVRPTSEAYHAGITVNEHQRVNIGVFNHFSRDARVTAIIHDRAGDEVQRIVFYRKSHSWDQKSIDVPITNGYIRWEINWKALVGTPYLWPLRSTIGPTMAS